MIMSDRLDKQIIELPKEVRWCKKCVMGTCGINESDVMNIQKLHESA